MSTSRWGGLLLRGLCHPALKCCDCNPSFCWDHREFAMSASKGHPWIDQMALRTHLCPSHCPEFLGEGQMVVISCACSAPWHLSMSPVHYHILYFAWTETFKKLLNNIILIRRKATDLRKRILFTFQLLRSSWQTTQFKKKEISFFPGPFIKRPCPAQNFGNVAYFLSLAVEVSLSVIVSITRLWHCADLSPRAHI